MANSADPDQLAQKPTDLDLHCLQRQGKSGFSRTRVNLQNKTSDKVHKHTYICLFGNILVATY